MRREQAGRARPRAAGSHRTHRFALEGARLSEKADERGKERGAVRDEVRPDHGSERRAGDEAERLERRSARDAGGGEGDDELDEARGVRADGADVAHAREEERGAADGLLLHCLVDVVVLEAAHDGGGERRSEKYRQRC